MARDRYPPGRQPYDVWNGARIGAIVGGLLGALSAILVGAAAVWIIVGGAMVGAFAGYWWERRRIDR